MPVAVLEARHQRPAFGIDDFGAIRRFDRFGDPGDLVAFDQHTHADGKFLVLAIENIGVLEQNLRFPRIILRRGYRDQESEEGSGQLSSKHFSILQLVRVQAASHEERRRSQRQVSSGCAM